MMKKKKIATCSSSQSISSNIITEANDVIIHVSVKLIAGDLLMEILSRLPPINLLRLKSVSKTWYSLISNPDFLRRPRRKTANQFDNIIPSSSDLLLKRHYFYNAHVPRILTLVPTNDYDEPAYYSFDHILSPLLVQKLIDYCPKHPLFVCNPITVIDSCNGLLLFRNNNNSCVTPIWRKYTLYVCNPITHNYIKLPTLLHEQEETEQGFKIRDYLSFNIVFDPSVSLTYKVVTWLTCTTTKEEEHMNKHHRLYVYSSETRSWRLSVSTNQIQPVDPVYISKRGVLCNGVLYWTNTCPSIVTHASLCYNVEKDVISTLKFPNMPPEYRRRILLYLGECGGRLRLIQKYYTRQQLNDARQQLDAYGFPSSFDVMELDNNDDSWTVKYRVNLVDEQEGHHANLIGNRVRIFDLYKTKTKKAAGDQHEIDQGEEEEELLLGIHCFCIIPFNLSSNKFGKELQNGAKKAGEHFIGFNFTDILRYDTFTLFPPSLSW